MEKNKFLSKGVREAKETIKYLDNVNINSFNYDFTYRMTNENLNYFKSLNLTGKSVLSVAASGDQYLELMTYNPKEIELYDVNNLAYYYSILKIVGAKVLSLNDFLKFFMLGSHNKSDADINANEYFDYGIYLKFREFLPREIKDYWDYMYVYESNRLIGINGEPLFYTNNNLMESVAKLQYLDYKNYLKLQNKLEKEKLPVFYKSHIKKLPVTIEKEYDVIITSNISDYFEDSWYKFVLEELSKLISDEGIMQYKYEWGNPKMLEISLGFEGFDYILVNSIRKQTDKDIVLTYKKNKTL